MICGKALRSVNHIGLYAKKPIHHIHTCLARHSSVRVYATIQGILAPISSIRFGKSLFLDTLKEIFEGNEALFRGLLIHPHWDWLVKYPVIRISFGGGALQSTDELQQSGQKVVVLVDEYDKPILDQIDHPTVALAMREALISLYSVIKDQDAHIRFAFLTGVSKFSKVSLFSGLNNLEDITLNPSYSALCGYTDADVESVFAPELFTWIARN